MKVLYDISVLGTGHIHSASRTGVFRTIENVAVALSDIRECQLTLCSQGGIPSIKESLTYLNETKKLNGIPFSKPLYYKRRIGIKEKKDRVFKSFESLGIRQKLYLKQLLSMERIYDMLSNDLVNPKDLRLAEIYHSPFYRIPEEIRSTRLKLFLNCYDLIPVLYPQYTEAGTRIEIEEMLKTIGPDTWVLCISQSTRNDLLNFLGKKADPDKVIVTELAASDVFYRSADKSRNEIVRKKYKIPEGPYVLSLCTLEPRKNIAHVIRAFRQVVKQESLRDLNLVLVGTKGWMYDKIFEEIKDDGSMKDRIVVTGYVADEDLASIYSNAILFVYPSFYEGFGLPPLEAMKCGTPVITSNNSSLPEVVGDAGLMVDPTDIDALCDSILSVYRDSDLRQEMVSKSLERANKFSWQRCAKETVCAYQSSLQ